MSRWICTSYDTLQIFLRLVDSHRSLRWSIGTCNLLLLLRLIRSCCWVLNMWWSWARWELLLMRWRGHWVRSRWQATCGSWCRPSLTAWFSKRVLAVSAEDTSGLKLILIYMFVNIIATVVVRRGLSHRHYGTVTKLPSSRGCCRRRWLLDLFLFDGTTWIWPNLTRFSLLHLVAGIYRSCCWVLWKYLLHLGLSGLGNGYNSWGSRGVRGRCMLAWKVWSRSFRELPLSPICSLRTVVGGGSTLSWILAEELAYSYCLGRCGSLMLLNYHLMRVRDSIARRLTTFNHRSISTKRGRCVSGWLRRIRSLTENLLSLRLHLLLYGLLSIAIDVRLRRVCIYWLPIMRCLLDKLFAGHLNIISLTKLLSPYSHSGITLRLMGNDATWLLTHEGALHIWIYWWDSWLRLDLLGRCWGFKETLGRVCQVCSVSSVILSHHYCLTAFLSIVVVAAAYPAHCCVLHLWTATLKGLLRRRLWLRLLVSQLLLLRLRLQLLLDSCRHNLTLSFILVLLSAIWCRWRYRCRGIYRYLRSDNWLLQLFLCVLRWNS